MKFFHKVSEAVQIIIMFAGVMVITHFALKPKPFAFLITTSIVALFTFPTFNRWVTAILSVAGILLYAASWPATSAWGIWLGMVVWVIGVIAWFTAVYETFSNYSATAKTVVVQ